MNKSSILYKIVVVIVISNISNNCLSMKWLKSRGSKIDQKLYVYDPGKAPLEQMPLELLNLCLLPQSSYYKDLISSLNAISKLSCMSKALYALMRNEEIMALKKSIKILIDTQNTHTKRIEFFIAITNSDYRTIEDFLNNGVSPGYSPMEFKLRQYLPSSCHPLFYTLKGKHKDHEFIEIINHLVYAYSKDELLHLYATLCKQGVSFDKEKINKVLNIIGMHLTIKEKWKQWLWSFIK